MRGAHDTRVDRNRFSSTNAFDGALLQKPQELDLQRKRNIAHFIEKQRTAISQFDLAFGCLDGTGESTLLMTEQLALEQIFGNSRAVDGNERALSAAAAIVDAPRQQFLAGTAGPQKHHRNIGRRHALDGARNLGHFRCGSDHRAQHRPVFPDLFRKAPVLALDMMQPIGALHDQPQRIDVHGFLVKVVGPLFDGSQGAFARAMAGGHDDLRIRFHGHDGFENGEALARSIRIGGKPKIERYDRRLLRA